MIISDEDWQHAETLACQLYDAAVDQVKTGSMYELYLQRFLELLKQADTTEEQVSRVRHLVSLVAYLLDKLVTCKQNFLELSNKCL